MLWRTLATVKRVEDRSIHLASRRNGRIIPIPGWTCIAGGHQRQDGTR